MTLAAVAAYDGDGRRGPVRIQARIRGVDMPQMPGDSGGRVVGGQLTLTVRATLVGAGTGTSAITSTVFAWEGYAARLLLTDMAGGDATVVPLEIEPQRLPLASATGPLPRLVSEQGGDSPQPVRVMYDGLTFVVDPAPFTGLRRDDTLAVEVERRSILDGDPITLIADVVAGSSGGRVVPRADGSLEIYRGTIGWNTLNNALGLALCLPALGLALIIAGVVALRLRR